MAKAKSNSNTIVLQPLNLQRVIVTIVGDSPLVVHAWSEKAKKMILDKQMKKALPKKEAKNPEQEFLDSIYWFPPENKPKSFDEWEPTKFRYGFPSKAFKKCAVDACSFVDNVTKVVARGAFHVEGEFVEVKGTPRPREDMVRVQLTTDIRYRAEFPEWKVDLPIVYNASVISLEQLVHLYEIAGFAVGVGEGRPQKDGQWGRFHVFNTSDLEKEGAVR